MKKGRDEMVRIMPRTQARIGARGLGLAISLFGLVAACAPHPCKEDDVSRLKCDPSADFSSASPPRALPGGTG